MNRLVLLVKGSALRGFESIVAIICGFLTLPIMLNGLGQDVYGLWVLITSFTAMMYLFDLGFASAVTRNISLAISKGNTDTANEVINSALVVYCCISILIVLFILALATNFTPKLVTGVTRDDFSLVLIMIGLGLAMEFPAKAFAGLFAAHYRYDLVSFYKIVFKLLHTAILIYLIESGAGIVQVALLSVAISALDTIAFLVMSRFVFKEMRLSRKYIKKKQLIELYKFSTWALLIDMGSLARSRMDVFFIGAFVSYSAVSIYYIPLRLVDYSIQLLYRMLGITLPIFTGHVGKVQNEAVVEDIVTIGRLNAYFASATLAFYILFGEILLSVWMGPDYHSELGHLVLLVLLLGRLSMLINDPLNNYLYAQGNHRLLAIFTVSEIILMLIGISYTCYYLGARVDLIAASVSLPVAISRLVVYPLLVLRKIIQYSIVKLIFTIYRPLTILIPIIAMLYLLKLFQISNLVYMFLGSLSILVCFSLYLLLETRRREKKILSKLTSVFLREARGTS